MCILRVFLFRGLCVQIGERALTTLHARKVQELFSYLLLYRDRPHTREGLADLLWGDCSTARSKKYLRQALWQLQSALEGQADLLNGQLLLVGPDWIQFNTEVDFWLDVAVLERAARRFRGVRGRDLAPQDVSELRGAVQLYQGDLLEGWYQDWCLYERERLQNMYLAMLDKLMGYCEVHHEYEAGLAYGTRILRYDRARERTHRRMMRLHYLARDRTAALRQYERCVAALDEELGVSPAEHTVALCEYIRADRFDQMTAALAEAAAMPAAAQVPDCLRYIRAILADVQQYAEQGIGAIDQALANHLQFTDPDEPLSYQGHSTK
jgi:DNA-binding SARP family transcriptional activator